MRSLNQKGIDVVDALFAMIIASMIATAILQGLGNWFSVRTQTANQDSANQYAQGIIAKANSVEWAKLGFDGDNSTLPEGTSAATINRCPTVFRNEAKIGDKTFKTVTLEGVDTPAGLAQTSVNTARGKDFCVLTDITWSKAEVAGDTPSTSYGSKTITVKVLWDDKGSEKSISVTSKRSPNIGEAVPSGLSEGSKAETSPIRSFSITKASNNGSTGRICYVGDWAETTDTVSLVRSLSNRLSPAAQSIALNDSDNRTERCMDVPTSVSEGYYGIAVSDSAGTKFVSFSDYQFPGSKVSAENATLTWTAYPWAGVTKHHIMKSTSADFSNPTLLTTTTETSYNLGTVAETMWVRVETENSEYAVRSYSDILEVQPVTPTAPPTSTPTPSPTPTPVNNPSIVSASDIIAYDSAKELWNYGKSGSSTVRKSIDASKTEIPKETFVTDWNNDGIQDLVIQRINGELVLRKGLASGGFTNTMIGTGWQDYDISIGKWKKTDTYPSVIARKISNGELYNYINSSGGSLSSGARTLVGTGWGTHLDSLNLLDWDKDGSIDVLTRNDAGEMKLYRTNGSGSFLSETRPTIGGNWNSMNSIRTMKGYNGPGTVGLLTREASTGDLYYYEAGNSAWSPRIKISGGWGPYTLAGN